MLATAAGAIVLMVIVVAVLRRPAGGDPPNTDVAAVFPFQYRGTAEHAYLAEGS
jgi:hypothetical protein